MSGGAVFVIASINLLNRRLPIRKVCIVRGFIRLADGLVLAPPRSTMKIPAIAAALTCLLLFPRTSAADGIGVQILQTTYTTMVGTDVIRPFLDNAHESTSRTNSSANPISDAQQLGGTDWAVADAGMFEVGAQTDAVDPSLQYSGHSAASAKSTIQFTPVSSGVTTLDVVFAGLFESYYSEGSISLSDLTTNGTLGITSGPAAVLREQSLDICSFCQRLCCRAAGVKLVQCVRFVQN